jgi:hypothetical protein
MERAWRWKGETKSGVSTISLGRLQYIRWVTAGPIQKTKETLHPSRFLTFTNTTCVPLQTTVTYVNRNLLHQGSVLCCARIEQLTVFWYVTPWYVATNALKNPATSIPHFHFHYNILRNVANVQSQQNVRNEVHRDLPRNNDTPLT